MAWRVARNIVALFGSFNTRFPGRDRATDGTIGDDAHKLSPSGHNPDDTPGSLPESNDPDSEAEVRAGDVDADLRTPGVTMWDVVHAILASPDRDRLLYIIHAGKIWSKSQGWRERVYTGSNPHNSHAHYSGDPASDEDTRPWLSVQQFGGEAMAPDTPVLNVVLDGATARYTWNTPDGHGKAVDSVIFRLSTVPFPLPPKASNGNVSTGDWPQPWGTAYNHEGVTPGQTLYAQVLARNEDGWSQPGSAVLVVPAGGGNGLTLDDLRKELAKLPKPLTKEETVAAVNEAEDR